MKQLNAKHRWVLKFKPTKKSHPFPNCWSQQLGGMEEEVGYWKQNLYLLQEAAPRPFPVVCTVPPESLPPQVSHLLFFFSWIFAISTTNRSSLARNTADSIKYELIYYANNIIFELSQNWLAILESKLILTWDETELKILFINWSKLIEWHWNYFDYIELQALD